MLIMREQQLEAIGAPVRLAFQAIALRLLKERHADLAQGLSDAYLGILIGTATDACRSLGREGTGDALDFAESLLTDDAHPLSRDAIAAKAERLGRDLRARELYLHLQSLQASQRGEIRDTAASGNAEPSE